MTDCEIINSRRFPYPAARLFAAFRDPQHLAQWWGPAGFTNTFEEFDFRPGGHWRFVMHGPDGTGYTNHSVFQEIDPDRRIVIEHLGDFHHFWMTLLFTEEAGQTELSWRMRFDTAEHCAKIRPIAEPANEQNFDRLAAQLPLVS